ncbi:MAG: Ada metal-binding domain-containing protein [Ferruginibacter sp.]
MITHVSLGQTAFSRAGKLFSLIEAKEVLYAGNAKLKIYGLLNCKSGKRMKTENRVFFCSSEEAVQNGYRPCGHCMKAAYLLWRRKQH